VIRWPGREKTVRRENLYIYSTKNEGNYHFQNLTVDEMTILEFNLGPDWIQMAQDINLPILKATLCKAPIHSDTSYHSSGG
jgi:hypothetical protein